LPISVVDTYAADYEASSPVLGMGTIFKFRQRLHMLGLLLLGDFKFTYAGYKVNKEEVS
jgi:hypothetical protein